MVSVSLCSWLHGCPECEPVQELPSSPLRVCKLQYETTQHAWPVLGLLLINHGVCLLNFSSR